MQGSDVDLLTIDRGVVTAPAGCGKTHLIAQALTRHGDGKPILVLTHTNAGVDALRRRLDQMGVTPRCYRLATIDGWAMRLISNFPKRSGHNPELLELRNAPSDYPSIRLAAVNLLRSGHIANILAATYSRLVVDEYQDCSILQHNLIAHAAETLPTAVLGDPMQAIFGFGTDRLAAWDNESVRRFPGDGGALHPVAMDKRRRETFGVLAIGAAEKPLRARTHRSAGCPIRGELGRTGRNRRSPKALACCANPTAGKSRERHDHWREYEPRKSAAVCQPDARSRYCRGG